jgi:hypothetical protein
MAVHLTPRRCRNVDVFQAATWIRVRPRRCRVRQTNNDAPHVYTEAQISFIEKLMKHRTQGVALVQYSDRPIFTARSNCRCLDHTWDLGALSVVALKGR